MATFYIEAIENTNIALVMVGSPTIGTVKYGVNDSACPNTYTVTTESTPISLTAGQKCYWTITSTSTTFSDSDYLNFTSTAKINVGGNMSDLIGGETQIPRNYCFYGLFYNCTDLVSASNLVLVNDFNSKGNCYRSMFQNCTSLTTTPTLPATTITTYCYQSMFYGCKSLTIAPELPATTLATQCYQYMFNGCTSLTTAPALLATTLESNCYYSMFYGCTSLTTAPELPATTLAYQCYGSMFRGCTSLTTPPALPATTLANRCYYQMFYNCKSLTTAPVLPATTLASDCYQYMFYGCTSLTAPPALPATTLTDYCYQVMFFGCTNIKLSETQIAPYSIPYRIPSEGTGTEGTSPFYNMFANTGGTFKGTPTINTTYYLAPYATFYIEAVEDTDIKLIKFGTSTVGDAYYGIENHNVPNAYTYGNTIHLTAGQKCYWFITSTSDDFSYSNYLKFTSTAKINVGGNMSDLIGGDTKIPRNYCFYGLFYYCAKLVDASNLVFVNDFNSKSNCYDGMFQGCTSLTTPPTLPATILAVGCYHSMFYGCTSLTTPPELPATTLANSCYYYMFYGCTSLTIAPELPATTLADECYRYMFSGCTSLTTASALTATTLADGCYAYMFCDCTSLTTPPALPATALANYCYRDMFDGCTNIKLSRTQTTPYLIPYRIPSEGIGTVGTYSLDDMFTNTGGTFTGTPTINTTYYLVPYATFYIEAVEDTDITLSKVGSPTVGDACYGVNDHGVSNVYTYGDTIHLTAGQKCYWFITSTSTNFSLSDYLKFTSTAKINVGGNISDLIGGENKIPRSYCFYGLFYNCKKLVSASNLVLVNDFNSKGSCYQSMFQGCTSLTTAPTLPATTLTTQCYNSMFYGCTSLTTPPALPATTLADDCYLSMFNGCTSLTIPPELPATTLAAECYWLMFSGCTSLVIAPELPATTLARACYQQMFKGCTSLTTAPTLPATTLAPYCYSEMFRDCTSLTTPPALPATTLKNYCYKSMFQGCTNIKLSETQTAPYSIPYRIPSEGTGTEGTGSLDDMFTDTGGTFKGTPTINKIYYLAPPSSPIYITYKGQELANFESGSKTLKCGGKYMEGDVIIAREIGTNNVVVLYNSGTILTFQNGTKTLKCAGKGMATDLVVQTS